MFNGLFYTVDPTDGSYVKSFDTESMSPRVATSIRGGMPGIIAMPRSGKRLIFASFMAGQVAMLDITNPNRFEQLSVVNLGPDAGPHSVHLTHDDKRLVVTDYFLNQDGFGKVHAEGDHKVRVFDVKPKGLAVDPAFMIVDFNTAFATGPARPHGIGMK
jgi:selenium-binding protein 1